MMNIKDVFCGEFNTFILLENGKLLATGRNIHGELGLGFNEFGKRELKDKFKFIYSNIDNVEKVICGYNSTFVITRDGKLLCTGEDAYGKLGLGYSRDLRFSYSHSLFKDTGLRDVKQVECSNYLTCILNKNGELMVAGSDVLFKTYTEAVDYLPEFEYIDVSDIRQIACGYDYIAIITNKDKLLMVGSNGYGQLGLHDNNRRTEFITTDVAHPEKVFCGKFTTFVITKDKRLLATGCNVYGELGLGDFKERCGFVDTGLRNIKEVIQGANSTFLISEDGKLLVSGRNEHGQLFLDHNENINKFIYVDNINSEDIKTISCGERHSVILFKNGVIETRGCNKYGQLGFENKIIPPKKKKKNTCIEVIKKIFRKIF